jgi:hypothetical protein
MITIIIQYNSLFIYVLSSTANGQIGESARIQTTTTTTTTNNNMTIQNKRNRNNKTNK